MRALVSHPWFALADFFLVVFAILLLELVPGLGGLSLFLAALPWLVRASTGRFPFERTRFDWLLLVFLITALIGTWTAYDPDAAWQKFWLLVGGLLLFYALAGQPSENHWHMAWFACFLGAGIALFFLLVNDWQAYPTKMRLVNQIGSWWMNVRPSFLAQRIPVADIADPVAGYIAFIIPLWSAIVFKIWQEKKPVVWALFLTCGVLVGVAFLLANSWDTTVALGAGMCLWGGWVLVERFGRRYTCRRSRVIGAAVASAFLLVVALVFAIAGGPQALVHHYVANSRQDVALGGYKLIGDYLFTGAGLGSFAGLYSQYIIEVPYFYAPNSHNLYLDVTLEQGIFGVLALVAIYTGSAWMLLSAGRNAGRKLLIQAVLSSLTVMLLQGLVDEILYSQRSAYLLFAIPGMACAVSRPWLKVTGKLSQALTISLLALLAVLLILILFRWQVVSAAWRANLGAVQLAKIELQDFPAGSWEEDADLHAFTPAEIHFRAALQQDPNQHSALMYLGHISALRHDFASAVTLLERAHQVDPTHPGIVKSLAFMYTWNGQFDQAVEFLQQVPGARQELEAYTWWWKEQGREDLSANAVRVLELLGE